MVAGFESAHIMRNPLRRFNGCYTGGVRLLLWAGLGVDCNSVPFAYRIDGHFGAVAEQESDVIAGYVDQMTVFEVCHCHGGLVFRHNRWVAGRAKGVGGTQKTTPRG